MTKFKTYFKLARKNMKSMGNIRIPYVVATGLAFSILYIFIALIDNAYIRERAEFLVRLMMAGAVIMGVFVVIFYLYTSRFAFSQRQKEFALYAIYGMEGRDVGLILAVETVLNSLLILALSTGVGFLLGKVLFVLLNRLLQYDDVRLSAFPFSAKALVINAGVLAGLALVLIFWNLFSLNLDRPIEQLRQDKSGLKQRKSYWQVILGVFGLGLIITGYQLARSTFNIVTSVFVFVVATVLVIIGTYLVTNNILALIFKGLRSMKGLYYKPSNFISFSGMLYKLRSNTNSLASLAVLSTGVILVVAVSCGVYISLEDSLKSNYPQDYKLDLVFDEDQHGQAKEEIENQVLALEKDLEDSPYFKDIHRDSQMICPGSISHDKELVLEVENNLLTGYLFLFHNVEAYNKMFDKDFAIASDELVVGANNDEILKGLDTLKIGEKTFKVKRAELSIPSIYAIDTVKILVAEDDVLQDIASNYLEDIQETENQVFKPALVRTLNFDVEDAETVPEGEVEKIVQNVLHDSGENYSMDVSIRDQHRQNIYELNGGILFVGIFLSIVLILGVFLVIYYKQVAEAIQDQSQVAIMQAVGLENELILKTTKKQMRYLFIWPLILTFSHVIAAYPITWKAVSMLVTPQSKTFLLSYVLAGVLLLLVYFIVYELSSGTYYRLVKHE
jgi:bacitracin transport system permease protein